MNQPIRVGQTFFPPKPHGIQKQPVSKPGGKPFQEWLAESLQSQAATTTRPLTFSQHAKLRLQERGIQLGEADLHRLEHAVQKAENKGAKESLIMMDNVAYVVSIVNRKVITAVDEGHMKENVFTNIDSAIFV